MAEVKYKNGELTINGEVYELVDSLINRRIAIAADKPIYTDRYFQSKGVSQEFLSKIAGTCWVKKSSLEIKAYATNNLAVASL